MGGKYSRLTIRGSRSSKSSKSQESAPTATEPSVVPRGPYDADLRAHLLGKATPQKAEMTFATAAVFVARARRAQQVVAQRKDRGSVVAGPSPSQAERHAEEVRRHMSREERIEDGLALLRQRVDFAGVKVVHMEDDGNCQFRSLAHELYGSQEHHGVVRRRVVEWMTARRDEYSFFVGDDAEFSEYLEKMAKSRTWGDEPSLRAACDAYGCVVHVVTTEHENWLMNYSPASLSFSGDYPLDCDLPPGTRECFLAYVSPIHYNVIVPLDSDEPASPTGY